MGKLKKVMAVIIVLSAVTAWAQGSDNIFKAIMSADTPTLKMLLEKNPKLLEMKNKAGLTPLNFACINGDLDVFSFLVEAGADITAGDNENSKPIHNAAASGCIDVVDFFLDKGVDIDITDDNGMTCLLFAASRQRWNLLENLVKKGADINAQSNNGFSPLLLSVIRRSMSSIKLLLENGADVNGRSPDGKTPLHTAAAYGYANILNLLIDNGAKIDIKCLEGETPLSIAVNPNTISAATILIEKGANVNNRSINNVTPLHNAAGRGSLNIVKLLIDNGAVLELLDQWKRTPLSVASSENIEIVKYLISKGAKVNPPYKNIRTPLINAVHRGKNDIAKLLIEKGANINAANEDGMTSLHTAVKQGDMEIAELLVSAGAQINIQEIRFGRTEVHTAAINGNTEMVEMLIAIGGKTETKDKKGLTPLDYALYHQFKDVAYQLSGKNKGEGDKVFNKPSLLHSPLKDKEAVVWHLGHSGWAIKTKNNLLIFDYFEMPDRIVPKFAALASGFINPEELKDQKVTVFSTHAHGDHYQDSIFEWKDTIPNIEYVLGHTAPGKRYKYTYIGPRSKKSVNGMKISTIRSNDEGVGFLVIADGLTIFHAGDHASGKNETEKSYKAEIEFLAKANLDIDLAFFPIVGCGIGDPDRVKQGVHYAMKTLKPRLSIPMHGGTATHRYQDFVEKMRSLEPSVKMKCAINMGDRFTYRGATKVIDL